MSEYISRKAILGYLNDIWLTATPTDSTPAEDKQFAVCRCMGLQDAMDAVKEFPAADVVEVVRCGECKYWEHRPDRRYDLCAYYIGAKFSRTPEDFCSRGERKGGQVDAE